MGHWNDPDVLPIGTGKADMIEEFSLFFMWAVSKAPLIFAADPEVMPDTSAGVLRSYNAININQDELGNPT